jgi:ribulose-5-phosphate 4-epimerase/fuculose-1-phosphate aldolase
MEPGDAHDVPEAAEGEAEGVIRFRADHRPEPLAEPDLAQPVEILASWRRIARALGVLGQAPARYGGAGFGNISLRLGAGGEAPGARRFLISGTQTGERDHVGAESFALVERYAIDRNRVTSRGEVLPSSESMTHAAVYDSDDELAMVIHGHAPELWKASSTLGLLETDAAVPYGTPAMAVEVTRALEAGRGHAGPAWRRRVIAMRGHEDGILAVGRDPEEAGAALVAALAAAWQLAARAVP